MTFLPGPHSITASYGGDASYNSSSTPAPVHFTITQAQVQTTLEPFPSVIEFDDGPIGMIVDISTSVGFSPLTKTFGGIAMPTGMITIYVGTTQVGAPFGIRGNVDGQSRTLTGRVGAIFHGVDFPLGHNMVTAAYSGDSNYAGTSPPLSRCLSGTRPVQNLAYQEYLAPGENVVVTADVTTSLVGGPPITGTFQFSIDSQNVGPPVPIVNGQATYSTSSLAIGSHGLRATYSGDNSYIGSLDSDSVTVLGPDFTIVPSQTPSTIMIAAPGASSTPIAFMVTGMYGYNGTINFAPASCSISPFGSESSCSFNPSSITGSGTTQITIATTAPHTSLIFPFLKFTDANGLYIVGITVAALFYLAVCLEWKRRWSHVYWIILVLTIMSIATSCGGSGGTGGSGGVISDPGTPRNITYTVTVTATATGTQTTHTTSFTFVVQ